MSQPLFPESPRTNCFPVVFSARAFFLLAWCGLMVLPAPAAVRYVNLNNPTPAPPYTSWATAARTIQDAVDVTVDGDEVLVTNGVYRTGGRLAPAPPGNYAGTVTNRVTVTNRIVLRSVNGSEETIIEGHKPEGSTGQTRCVDLLNSAWLAGFTLTNGKATYIHFTNIVGVGNVPYVRAFGSGVRATPGAVISNCVIAGNFAGAYGGTLVSCKLVGNAGGWSGGGAESATLNNCLVEANSAERGGGVYDSIVNGCVLVGNSSTGTDYPGLDGSLGGGAFQCVLNNCILMQCLIKDFTK